jgi:1-acyl-sn-glycerol-3-phosphate acyltransferase
MSNNLIIQATNHEITLDIQDTDGLVVSPIKDDNNTTICMNIQCGTCHKRFDNCIKLPACVNVPCQHLTHDTDKCKTFTCGICNAIVEKYLSKSELDQRDQRYIDIVSVTRDPIVYSFWRKFIGYGRLLSTIPMLTGMSVRMFMDHLGIPLFCADNRKWINLQYLLNINRKVCRLLKINIKVTNREKLVNDKSKRIIICNHSNYHDMFCMATVDTMGFVASPAINNFSFGRAITRTYPHVLVENDTTSKMKEKDRVKINNINPKAAASGGLDRMKEFLSVNDEQHMKLMICPEGMLSNAHCLTKFRSSAFKCNYPIQPVVIKYQQNVFDIVNQGMFNNEKIDVEIIVLDKREMISQDYNSPVFLQQIEDIRHEMATVGGFALSRVENRSNFKKENNNLSQPQEK